MAEKNYPDRPVFRVAVFVIIRDQADRILLMQRADTEFPPGYYDFPSGHVENGESFTSAAVREVAEETGTTIKEANLRLLSLKPSPIPPVA